MKASTILLVLTFQLIICVVHISAGVEISIVDEAEKAAKLAQRLWGGSRN